MKEVEKTIMVPACEICGEEISSAIKPVQVVEKGGRAVKEYKDEKANPVIQSGYYNKEDTIYYFHPECVNKLLIETAKELNK